MTLVLVAANPRLVMMAADRRVSSRGRLVYDESNKVALLLTRDARLLVGFTGLAADYRFQDRLPAPAGRFRTSYWILEALLKAAPPDYCAEPMLERFASEAQRVVSGMRLPRHSRGLLVGFTGFRYSDPGQAELFHRDVTNFVDGTPDVRPDFEVGTATADGSPLASSFVLAYGCLRALGRESVEGLGKLARERRPAVALVGKAVEVMREAAASPRSGGAIGSQVNTVLLHADATISAQAEYHTTVNTNVASGINSVDARGGQHVPILIGEPTFTYGDPHSEDLPAVFVPKVEQNWPCPCLSGRRYKHCHGRTAVWPRHDV